MTDSGSYLETRARFVRALGHGAVRLHHERHTGFSTDPHAHEAAQLLLPLAGRMRLLAAGADHALSPEWALLVASGVPHAVAPLAGELEFIALYLPADWLAEAASTIGLVGAVCPEVLVVREPGLWAWGRQLGDELAESRPGRERFVEAALSQLAVYMARALVRPERMEVLSDPAIMRAVDRMVREYAEPLTVEALAAEAAMSPRHFERRFKQVVGYTPKKFLIEVRVAAASEMLEATTISVAEVGFAVGFQTPSHFTETFQRLRGMTPSAHRAEASGG